MDELFIHRNHLRKSMSLTKRSERECMESYGAYLCIALDLPRLDVLAYAKFADSLS